MQQIAVEEVAEHKCCKIETRVTNRPKVLPIENTKSPAGISTQIHVCKITVLRECILRRHDRLIRTLYVAKECVGPNFAADASRILLTISNAPTAFRKSIGAGVQPDENIGYLREVPCLAQKLVRNSCYAGRRERSRTQARPY